MRYIQYTEMLQSASRAAPYLPFTKHSARSLHHEVNTNTGVPPLLPRMPASINIVEILSISDHPVVDTTAPFSTATMHESHPATLSSWNVRFCILQALKTQTEYLKQMVDRYKEKLRGLTGPGELV